MTTTGLKLNEFVASGTHAARLAFGSPAPFSPASGPNPSAIWYETDTHNMYAWDFVALSWNLVQGAAATITSAMGITMDGGGSVLTTGIKGDLFVPVACTITEAVLLADQAGSIVVDIWKAAVGAYPPLVAGSIVAADPPTLTAANKMTDVALTGWTTAVAAGDTLRFNVNSVATLTRAHLSLRITVP